MSCHNTKDKIEAKILYILDKPSYIINFALKVKKPIKN